MAVKKVMRRIDLGFQLVIALKEQLAGELLPIISLLKRAMQRQRVKSEPDLRRVTVDFVDSAQEGRERGRPGLIGLLFQVRFESSFHDHQRSDRNFSP